MGDLVGKIGGFIGIEYKRNNLFIVIFWNKDMVVM